ncbi:MAG: hypothetical protein IAE78_03640 [Myxococcus sp.]|nr:hypothetical protein [Myxococcus sp.]
MSTTTDGVHRLVDMVVEEVSLVDRAANLRRFLIVKRDDTMDDTEDAKKADAPDDSPLQVAIAALENLTEIVEELGEDASDPRVTSLAEQLRAASEDLLERASSEAPADDDATKAAARPRRGKKPEPKNPPADDGEMTDATSKVDLRPITEGLTKLTETFKALSESVTSQAQRLGRVEKQFGLPNSIPTQPATPKTKPDDEVAWPLDLNNPLDRDSVEKSLSFHES